MIEWSKNDEIDDRRNVVEISIFEFNEFDVDEKKRRINLKKSLDRKFDIVIIFHLYFKKHDENSMICWNAIKNNVFSKNNNKKCKNIAKRIVRFLKKLFSYSSKYKFSLLFRSRMWSWFVSNVYFFNICFNRICYFCMLNVVHHN